MEIKNYVKKIQLRQGTFLSGYRRLLKQLDIELTERCNNNCIHCCINLPEKDKKAKKKELSTQKILNIIKEASELGCSLIRFTGGEPLLRDDFEEIYTFTRRLGLSVLLFTNATLITPHLVSVFVRTPPSVEIEITLYGMKSSSYESVSRKPGSFEAAWRGIHMLWENNIPFVVKSVFLPANKSEVNRFLAWVDTIPWMRGSSQITMLFDLRSRRDSEIKNQQIRLLRPSPEQGLKLLTRFQNGYVNEMKIFFARQSKPPNKVLFTCGAGLTTGSVDAYGFFQPCLLLRHPKAIYDLQKGSLRDALVNFFPVLRKKNAKNHEYLQRCAVCFLKGLLCEQCPGKSWIEHGTLDTPVNYLCEMAQVQARFIGLLTKDEKPWEVKDWHKRINDFISG